MSDEPQPDAPALIGPAIHPVQEPPESDLENVHPDASDLPAPDVVSPWGAEEHKQNYRVSTPEHGAKIVRAIDSSEAIRVYREASGITSHVARYDCDPVQVMERK